LIFEITKKFFENSYGNNYLNKKSSMTLRAEDGKDQIVVLMFLLFLFQFHRES